MHFFVSLFTGLKLTMLAETSRPVSLSKYPPFHRCMRGTNQKNPRCVALVTTQLKTHIALFTKTVRPYAGNSQCPAKMAKSMRHVTEPVQNTDFRKSEKSSISTGCAKNESSVTSGINFSVAVFVRHSVYLHNNDIINTVHGGGDGSPIFLSVIPVPSQPYIPVSHPHWSAFPALSSSCAGECGFPSLSETSPFLPQH